ncbi:hypothetical protein M6D81_21065 [Paenibacillus sp. J5C_2022]|uniref:hypothetical protein n=1 Tax=Paenibacillus sp. J5C2022 TaxID=2977129 RepID=UPI0021D3B0BF|nr:hypothetical protein [Paenibacillus sp. J5C2022]MCU6711188.1 hypothetical protein [Paenibacillus sp. J5C2022]
MRPVLVILVILLILVILVILGIPGIPGIPVIPVIPVIPGIRPHTATQNLRILVDFVQFDVGASHLNGFCTVTLVE